MQGMLVMKRLPWEPNFKERRDATFVLHPGLLCRANSVSLEAAARPGHYIKLDRAAGAVFPLACAKACCACGVG